MFTLRRLVARSYVGLRWWAGVYLVCVPLVASWSSSCLLMHS